MRWANAPDRPVRLIRNARARLPTLPRHSRAQADGAHAEFGAGKAHFDQAEREAPTLADLRAAQAEAAANPTLQNRAKAARLLAAFRAYHDLPSEHDAFATEDDLGLTWDEATPTP